MTDSASTGREMSSTPGYDKDESAVDAQIQTPQMSTPPSRVPRRGREPSVSTLLEWLDGGDERARSSAIVQLSARHAVRVHGSDPHLGLTEYGIASCAASHAVVLMDPHHPNRSLVMDRWRQEAERASA